MLLRTHNGVRYDSLRLWWLTGILLKIVHGKIIDYNFLDISHRHIWSDQLEDSGEYWT